MNQLRDTTNKKNTESKQTLFGYYKDKKANFQYKITCMTVVSLGDIDELCDLENFHGIVVISSTSCDIILNFWI